MRESKASPIGNNESPFPYVVDIEDNRQCEEPLTAWITCATHADIRKMDEDQLSATMRSKGDAAIRTSVAGIAGRRDALIRKYVHRVENYAYTDLKGVRHVPTNGHELLKAFEHGSPGEAEIVLDDLKEAILDAGRASEGLLKNSDASQPST